jgi:hypothetical protein
MKLINFYLVKKAYFVKREDFFPNLFVKSAFYGLHTEPNPEPEL